MNEKNKKKDAYFVPYICILEFRKKRKEAWFEEIVINLKNTNEYLASFLDKNSL